MEILTKIKKTGNVPWRTCRWLQPENLKSQTAAQKEKLKESIKANGFLMPFLVWENESEIFILDGHHRQPALLELEKEGHKIPDDLPAVWIDVRDEREARKILLIYNSAYSSIIKEGLFEFIADLDPTELLKEINLSDFDKELSELLKEPDFEPGTEEEQSDLDKKAKNHVCPNCGHEF